MATEPYRMKESQRDDPVHMEVPKKTSYHKMMQHNQISALHAIVLKCEYLHIVYYHMYVCS